MSTLFLGDAKMKKHDIIEKKLQPFRVIGVYMSESFQRGKDK